MSSALSQQVKWISFLLLFIRFLELPSPATSGKCQRHCNEHRPTRYEGYTFDCEYEYYDYEDQDKFKGCTTDVCQSCSSTICDPSNPNIINCPEIDLARCEKLCDDNRPSGSTSAYTLECDKIFKSKADINKCKSHCDHCFEFICDSDNPNVYNCPGISPPPPIGESCKDHCDQRRDDEFPFEFHCSYYYNIDDYDALKECRKNCTHCSRQICNPYDNPDKFKCPIGPSICELQCDRNRPAGSTSAYIHDCSLTIDTDYYGDCSYLCGLCSQICNLEEPNTFNCPAKGTLIPTSTTTTTTTTTTTPPTTTQPPYKGPCEDRCNSKRPKGSQEAFKIKCDDYSDDKEKMECIDGCDMCPENVCHEDYWGNVEYNCPYLKLTRRCDDHCNANRESTQAYKFDCWGKYKTHEEIEYCRTFCRDCPDEICKNIDPSSYNCPAIEGPPIEKPESFNQEKDPLQVVDEPGSEQLSTLAIVGIGLGILLLVLTIGGIIFFVMRRRKAKNQVKPGPEPIPEGEFESSKYELSPDPSSSSISIAESGSSINSVSASPSSHLDSTHTHKNSKKSKK